MRVFATTGSILDIKWPLTNAEAKLVLDPQEKLWPVLHSKCVCLCVISTKPEI